MIKVVNIKGANGSGKTTIVHQMLQLSKEVSQLRTEDGTVIATCMDTIKWAAVGPYYLDKKMGGCDIFETVDSIKQAILTTRQACPDYWIVFEGMMISTLKTTFYNFLVEMMQTDDIVPAFVILRADVDGCLRRIKDRGTIARTATGEPNPANIKSKCDTVLRHAQDYDPCVVRYIDVDKVACSGMLSKFLDAVGDTKLLDWMFDYQEVEEIEYVKPFSRNYTGPEWLAPKSEE